MDDKELIDSMNELCIEIEDILKLMQNAYSDKMSLGIRLKTFEDNLNDLRLKLEDQD